MKRGDIFRITKPPGDDPRKHRYFVVVSRDALISSRFSTVICAPIYTQHDALATQVEVGIEEGLRHRSSIHCDAFISIPKNRLTHYVGHLSTPKLHQLSKALMIALDVYADEVE
ncbi:MAG: type II toxin-antitoxin system PemK/MazF family toxin [Caldilineaceae bacterium]